MVLLLVKLRFVQVYPLVMAKKWPTSILAVSRLISALSCESGVHFRGGTQRVFEGELHMIVCVQIPFFS